MIPIIIVIVIIIALHSFGATIYHVFIYLKLFDIFTHLLIWYLSSTHLFIRLNYHYSVPSLEDALNKKYIKENINEDESTSPIEIEKSSSHMIESGVGSGEDNAQEKKEIFYYEVCGTYARTIKRNMMKSIFYAV